LRADGKNCPARPADCLNLVEIRGGMDPAMVAVIRGKEV
jgi:hypothetical protein